MSSGEKPSDVNNTSNDAICKIFVGNVNKTTLEEDFKTYFESYGPMKEVILMKDNNNPIQNRGFGFVTPERVEVTDKILIEPVHVLDGRELDVKRALPKDIDDPLLHVKTPRIFLGGLPHNVAEEEITNFFNERYAYLGAVKEVVIKKERQTGRPRGFCFVSFENPHVVDKMMIEMRYPIINNKRCEIKKADPAVPITGVPPSQLPKYPSRPQPSGQRGSQLRGQGMNMMSPSTPTVPVAMGANQSTYDYNGYSSTNPNMMAYPQSNAYYSYYQNQANMASGYPQSATNTAGYSTPYGYGADQRGMRGGYSRPNYPPSGNRGRPY